MLIGISGKRGTGKSLLGTILCAQEGGFIEFSFAGALKSHCKVFMWLTEEQVNGPLKETETTQYPGYTPRQIMIDVGMFYRKYDPDFWVRQVMGKIKSGKNVCITDVRFDNEYQHIRKAGGIIVRLERKPELNIYKTLSDDPTERDLDHHAFDYVFGADFNIFPSDLELFAKRILSDTEAHRMA